MSGMTLVTARMKANSRRVSNSDSNWTGFAVWLAPIALVCSAVALTHGRGGWPQMWATAFAIYFASKAWVLMVAARNGVLLNARGIAMFCLAWAGMDPRPFAIGAARMNASPQVGRISWIEGLIKLFVGIALLLIAPGIQVRLGTIAATWVCMSAYVLVLHFGVLHLIGYAWQLRGVAVDAIMQQPLRSTSLLDFWSRRWNRAFRDVSHSLVVRPTRRLFGPAGAVGLVFVVSGLVHEMLMSWPSRGGWGLPTAYFVTQGVAMFVERSRSGRRVGLGRGAIGRVWTAAIVIGPLPLLVHGPFVERVVIPFFEMLEVLQ